MKTKILDKKKKKLSLNKAFSLTKPKQQKNAVESKKVAKKAKLAISVQNGNPTLGNKVQFFNVDKKKLKQNKGVKQQNAITVSSKTKIKTKGAKEEMSSTAAEPKKDILNETDTKNLEYLQRRQKRRNLRKRKRQQHHPFDSVASIKLHVEEAKKKIEEIRSREVLSKRAKKILAVLNRKLRLEELVNKLEQDKLDTMLKKSNKKGKHIQTHEIGALVKNKQTKNEAKIKAKKRHIQNKGDKIKSKRAKQYDINVMGDSDDEDESKDDQSDVEELMDSAKEQIDKMDKKDKSNKASISEVKKNKIKNKKQFESLDQEKEQTQKKKKQRMNVQFVMPNKEADVIKTSLVAKSKKLRVLQKAEKLAKGQGNQGKKKPMKKEKQKSGRGQKHNKKNMIN